MAIEDPVLRQRYEFRHRRDEDGGEVLEIDLHVDPGGGVTPHVHPAMEERFRVLSGRPQFLAGRRWRDAVPGDEIVIAPGTRHAFRNRGAETAHIVAESRPPSTLQEFLTEVAALSREGGIMRPGLPRGLRGLVETAAIAKRHRHMTVLLLPPPLVQRLLMDRLARFSRAR
jgi:quercetin dioxygenase-like cupin family protein